MNRLSVILLLFLLACNSSPDTTLVTTASDSSNTNSESIDDKNTYFVNLVNEQLGGAMKILKKGEEYTLEGEELDYSDG